MRRLYGCAAQEAESPPPCLEERGFECYGAVCALTSASPRKGLPQSQYYPPYNLASGNAFPSTKLHGIPALSVVEPSDTACWGSTEKPWTAALDENPPPGCYNRAVSLGKRSGRR